MIFVKIENGVVVQSQPLKAEGFISAPDYVICGMLWDGQIFTTPPAPLSIEDYRGAVQLKVDATARERNYGDGSSCASYVSSTNPPWAAEAKAFIAWRDSVWMFVFAELAKVQAGQRPVPTVEAFLAELPVIHWPGLTAI